MGPLIWVEQLYSDTGDYTRKKCCAYTWKILKESENDYQKVYSLDGLNLEMPRHAFVSAMGWYTSWHGLKTAIQELKMLHSTVMCWFMWEDNEGLTCSENTDRANTSLAQGTQQHLHRNAWDVAGRPFGISATVWSLWNDVFFVPPEGFKSSICRFETLKPKHSVPSSSYKQNSSADLIFNIHRKLSQQPKANPPWKQPHGEGWTTSHFGFRLWGHPMFESWEAERGSFRQQLRWLAKHLGVKQVMSSLQSGMWLVPWRFLMVKNGALRIVSVDSRLIILFYKTDISVQT